MVYEEVRNFSLCTGCINETDPRFHNWHFRRDKKDFHFLSMSVLGVDLFSIRTCLLPVGKAFCGPSSLSLMLDIILSDSSVFF